jgi:hypothetical protein
MTRRLRFAAFVTVDAERHAVPRCATTEGKAVTLVNAAIDEQAGREIASRLEAEHPLWMVVFGVYSQEFVCFPRFNAPSGTMLAAAYPGALPDRMRQVEETISRRVPRIQNSPRPGHG